MLEWLIVGGGIHGTYRVSLLTHQPCLAPAQVGILDPHEQLLAAWNRMATHCGMRFLRSPATHHVDRPVLSIYGFAKTTAGQLPADFIAPCNPCGYPVVGEDLQWGRNIYVTGPLAELQVGPCARNSVGTRNAGRMLPASISSVL